MQQLAKIGYDISKLKPVISEQGFQLHLNMYKQYNEGFNNKTGDIPFNKAGDFLHGIYFENIREFRNDNKPMGKVAEIIKMRYGDWDSFVLSYILTVDKLQGSGWVFMNTAGYLNIIPNNRIVDNVAMIIDFWEHAYLPVFGTDRIAYAKAHLNLINWEIVNKRIFDFQEKKKEKSL